MVVCIKYRKKLLFENEKVEFFKQVCLEIGKRYWFEFEAMGSDGDHVHVFVGAAPRYAPSNVMQIIKSITAKHIFHKYPDLKKQLWGGQFWSQRTLTELSGEEADSENPSIRYSSC